jgi:sporulation protein YlmC with PRC-barrel domain
MKKIIRSTSLGVAVSALLAASAVGAANNATNAAGNAAAGSNRMETGQPAGNGTANTRTDARGATGKLDVSRVASGMRAEKVIGSTVYNQADESIGSIDDLIIEPNDRVVYAIVSVGGFLGVGDRLVAVPFNQMNFRRDNNDTRVVIADSSKAQLQAMPEFRYNR